MIGERPEPKVRLSVLAGVIGLTPDHFSIAYGRLVIKDVRLPGLRLAEVDLGEIDFVDADLRGATFVSTYLAGADFDGGSLAGATFQSHHAGPGEAVIIEVRGAR